MFLIKSTIQLSICRHILLETNNTLPHEFLSRIFWLRQYKIQLLYKLINFKVEIK
jgi:hypothetical protein